MIFNLIRVNKTYTCMRIRIDLATVSHLNPVMCSHFKLAGHILDVLCNAT